MMRVGVAHRWQCKESRACLLHAHCARPHTWGPQPCKAFLSHQVQVHAPLCLCVGVCAVLGIEDSFCIAGSQVVVLQTPTLSQKLAAGRMTRCVHELRVFRAFSCVCPELALVVQVLVPYRRLRHVGPSKHQLSCAEKQEPSKVDLRFAAPVRS